VGLPDIQVADIGCLFGAKRPLCPGVRSDLVESATGGIGVEAEGDGVFENQRVFEGKDNCLLKIKPRSRRCGGEALESGGRGKQDPLAARTRRARAD